MYGITIIPLALPSNLKMRKDPRGSVVATVASVTLSLSIQRIDSLRYARLHFQVS